MIKLRNMTFFQLQAFRQLYLTELSGFLTNLGLLKWKEWMYPLLSTGFGLLVLFVNSRLLEFHILYLTLFLKFSVIDSFRQFWLGSLHKRTLLMPPLYTFMIILILFVILLFMLMLILSTLNVIRILIYHNR